MSESARIFDIQRFCVHDGPGIRTTVFFKGCPLRCRWCHNPESISSSPQYMVYAQKCTACGRCPGVSLAGRHVEDLGPGGHGGRYEPCPSGAREITGRESTVDEIVDAALRDQPFYQPGGVTLSGGEPLAQWKVTRAVAQRIRAAGVHVAIDTSAYAPDDIVDLLPDLFDLVIVDLKAVTPELHREWTGVDNAGILQSIRRLAETMGERLWISVPAVPGVQLGEEMTRIEEYIGSLAPGPLVRMIPYHELGTAKYAALGLESPAFGRESAGTGRPTNIIT